MYQHEEGNMNFELVRIMLNEENNFNYNTTNIKLINKVSTKISKESGNIIIISNFFLFIWYIKYIT